MFGQPSPPPQEAFPPVCPQTQPKSSLHVCKGLGVRIGQQRRFPDQDGTPSRPRLGHSAPRPPVPKRESQSPAAYSLHRRGTQTSDRRIRHRALESTNLPQTLRPQSFLFQTILHAVVFSAPKSAHSDLQLHVQHCLFLLILWIRRDDWSYRVFPHLFYVNGKRGANRNSLIRPRVHLFYVLSVVYTLFYTFFLSSRCFMYVLPLFR